MLLSRPWFAIGSVDDQFPFPRARPSKARLLDRDGLSLLEASRPRTVESFNVQIGYEQDKAKIGT